MYIDLNIKSAVNQFCETCALGKLTKLSHQTVENTNERLNDVTIHSDLVGPMRTKSIGGKQYIVTYLCSKTEYSFVYFLKHKDEQFEKFKKFKITTNY